MMIHWVRLQSESLSSNSDSGICLGNFLTSLLFQLRGSLMEGLMEMSLHRRGRGEWGRWGGCVMNQAEQQQAGVQTCCGGSWKKINSQAVGN